MGFFTKSEARAKTVRAKALPAETARLLGSSLLRPINEDALHPNIEPTGVGSDVDALVLLDWPSDLDDRAGVHCSGSLGSLYRMKIEGVHERVAYDYIVRTRPPDGRDARPVEIEAYRLEVEATILACRPHVVYALGHRVVAWVSPEVGYSMATHRGRVFAASVGGHRFWVVPAYPPRQAAKLFETGDARGSGDEIRRATWADLTRDSVRGASFEKRPLVYPCDRQQLLAQFRCTVERSCSVALVEGLAQFHEAAAGTLMFDVETNMKRPYGEGARILSFAVCDGVQTFSMAIDHPDAPIPAWLLDQFFRVLVELFRGRQIYAHNLEFDLEWLLVMAGDRSLDLLQAPASWWCSEVGAYILDQREGKSLDYLARLYYGLPLKRLSPPRLWEQKGALTELLEYGALDAAVAFRVAARQRMELRRLGRLPQFQYHMGRIPMIVRMQARGVPVDDATVLRFEQELMARRSEVLDVIAGDVVVRQYTEAVGRPFNPTSPDSVLKLFGEHLKCPSCYRDGASTTDAEALGEAATLYPIAARILELREVEKKLGTYVRRFRRDAEDGYVYPDGKIHSRFLSTRTQTRRLASVEPNGQNWPKRKGREVRGMVRADPGHVLVSMDLGQIEARCMAMLTLDPHVIRMFREPDYDIHMVWAEKLARAYPSVLRGRGFASVGKFRSAVKNEFVFPAFYGAGIKKVSRLTGLPVPVLMPLFEEFWAQFLAVRAWQKRQVASYEQCGYIETQLGFRRYGPLKYNMILNTEPQSLGSDFCVEAAIRMEELAQEQQLSWCGPIVNIHDDLLYHVPEERLEWFIENAVPRTIVTPHEFAKVVPLTCDVEVGKDWANMEYRESFRSDEL